MMKQFIFIIAALLISTYSFASTDSNATLDRLASAWKSTTTIDVNQSDDINIVYGGQDITVSQTEPSELA